MAYQGYLVRIGDWTIPFSYMKAETFNQTLYGLDLDTYTDANGMLHRNALQTKSPKVEFETPPGLNNNQVADFMANIRSRYINQAEKNVMATVYVQELDDYVTHEMYIPDITFTPYLANEEKIVYNPIRVALISYGGSV